jgi:predicted AAA+ superfamily ATPase
LANSENIGRISESVLCDHIVRLAFRLTAQKHTYEPTSSVFYWRSKKDREIDFIVRANERLIPIECKCQEEPKSDDMFAIAEFNSLVRGKYGLIVSQDILEVERNAVLIPLSLFLLLV